MLLNCVLEKKSAYKGKLYLAFYHNTNVFKAFPGGLVVKTLQFKCRESG